MNLGVQITTACGEPLSPGVSELPIDLHFWSDLADVFVVPSAVSAEPARARIELSEAADGGLSEPMPTPRNLAPGGDT
jgi:hypothetical protein